MGSNRSKPRNHTRRTPPLQPGWTVYGSDGEKIGTVAGVQGHYVVVEKKLILPDDVYVPRSAVDRVESHDVHLSLTKSQVDAEDWSALQVTEADSSDRAGSSDAHELERRVTSQGQRDLARSDR